MVNPVGTLLIAENYEGDERGTVMGLQTTANGVGMMLTMLAAGYLTMINWHYAFVVYLLGLVAFVLALLFIKKPAKNVGAEKVEEKVEFKDKFKVNGLVIFIAVALGFYFSFYTTIFTNLPLVVVGENIGNAAQFGVAMMVMYVVNLVTGIIFGVVFRHLKHFTLPLGALINAIAFIMLSNSHSMSSFTVALVLLGIGQGFAVPYVFYQMTVAGPKSSVGFCISLMLFMVAFGMFVSPYLVNSLVGLFGQTIGRFTFVLAAAIVFVGTAGFLINAIRLKVKASKSLESAA